MTGELSFILGMAGGLSNLERYSSEIVLERARAIVERAQSDLAHAFAEREAKKKRKGKR